MKVPETIVAATATLFTQMRTQIVLKLLFDNTFVNLCNAFHFVAVLLCSSAFAVSLGIALSASTN